MTLVCRALGALLILLSAVPSAGAQDALCDALTKLTKGQTAETHKFLAALRTAAPNEFGSAPAKSVIAGYSECWVSFRPFILDPNTVGFTYQCRRAQTTDPRTVHEAVKACLSAEWRTATSLASGRLPEHTVVFQRSPNASGEGVCGSPAIIAGGKGGSLLTITEFLSSCAF